MGLKSGAECWVKNDTHSMEFYRLSEAAFLLDESYEIAWDEVILWSLFVCTGCGTQWVLIEDNGYRHFLSYREWCHTLYFFSKTFSPFEVADMKAEFSLVSVFALMVLFLWY